MSLALDGVRVLTGQEGGEGGRPPYRAKDGWVVISAAGREMAARLMRLVQGDGAEVDASIAALRREGAVK